MTTRKTVKKKPIEDALKLAYRSCVLGDVSTPAHEVTVSLEDALMLVMGVEAYDQWCDAGSPIK